MCGFGGGHRLIRGRHFLHIQDASKDGSRILLRNHQAVSQLAGTKPVHNLVPLVILHQTRRGRQDSQGKWGSGGGKMQNTWTHITWAEKVKVSDCLGLSKKKKKVKLTLVQALRLCTGCTAHRGSRGIALPFHDHGTRRGEVSASCLGRLYPRERPGTHYTGGWMGPRAGLDTCGKSCPHRDSIPGPSSP